MIEAGDVALQAQIGIGVNDRGEVYESGQVDGAVLVNHTSNVGDGGYDAEDGSVVISQATNMSSITDAEPGTDDMKENFTGMILKVAKGKGTVKVKAKTSGNVQLVVQVGKGVPMLATMNEQGDAMIGYDVKEDSYVYIYAIMGSSLSRTTRASSDSELRIYDIAVSHFDTTPRLPGDTNNDGKLDIVDVTTILNTILGRE